MLDTIILTIPRGKFRLRPEMFIPNANILRSEGNYLVRCINNPTASDKKNKIYKPRMTLIKRMTKNGIEIPLKIEFSAPKILYDNNVAEVSEADFEKVVWGLSKKMADMGVYVELDVLRNASVAGFHPSKNIELKDSYTATYVIRELNKVNVTKKMDLNRDSFRNEGQSLQYYTNSHSLVIYDKIHDLRKPEKRAIDKDQNYIQLSLFEELTKKEGPQEILRIEVRLSRKVKLNAVMKKYGFPENPTFRQVFNKGLCQKIVNSYWHELIEDKNMFLFDMESGPKKTLRDVIKTYPEKKPKEMVYLVGLKLLSKDGKGIRELRQMLEKRSTKRTWYRIADDLKIVNKITGRAYHNWVQQIADTLSKFEPIRLST